MRITGRRPNISNEDLEGLLPYATEEERIGILACMEHPLRRDAAGSIGLKESALSARLARVQKRAASNGWAPEFDWRKPVPEGHRVRGNSTLYRGGPSGENGERNLVVEQQWVKSERDSDDPSTHQPVPEGHTIKKVSTLLDAQGKVRAQWIQAPRDEQERWDRFWTACASSTKAYEGIANPVSKPKGTDKDTVTVYPLGDPHIGMLSWGRETGTDFDLEIATRDMTATVDLLVDRAPSSRLAVLANVGDFFHAENDDQRTPNGGNKLDVDSRAAKVNEVGFTLMRRLVDRLLKKHEKVQVVNVPGNHDPRMARMLAMWMQAVFEREKRVEIISNLCPYIYIKHGKNLIGFAHGDGAKPAELPGIMAADKSEDWGSTEFRIWITGHIHHETCKEFPGCTVESFRTLAGRDYWHSWKGYRAGRSLSCITFHKDFGEITRSTVDLKLARSSR